MLFNQGSTHDHPFKQTLLDSQSYITHVIISFVRLQTAAEQALLAPPPSARSRRDLCLPLCAGPLPQPRATPGGALSE